MYERGRVPTVVQEMYSGVLSGLPDRICTRERNALATDSCCNNSFSWVQLSDLLEDLSVKCSKVGRNGSREDVPFDAAFMYEVLPFVACLIAMKSHCSNIDSRRTMTPESHDKLDGS